MIKSIFIGILAMPIFLSALKPISANDSVFGLPQTVTGKSETVGSLPYSSQWISERIGTYVYISYNSAQLASSVVDVGSYESAFGSTRFAYPSLDLFSHLFSFAGAESGSFARNLLIWGRFALGAADRTGPLSSTQARIDPTVESASLLLLQSRIGLLLGYDGISWIRPYAGIEIDPYVFRNTADLTGAEEQGGAYCYGPVVGAHFPVLFSGKASLLAEYHKAIALQGSGQLFGTSDSYTAGLGMTF